MNFKFYDTWINCYFRKRTLETVPGWRPGARSCRYLNIYFSIGVHCTTPRYSVHIQTRSEKFKDSFFLDLCTMLDHLLSESPAFDDSRFLIIGSMQISWITKTGIKEFQYYSSRIKSQSRDPNSCSETEMSPSCLN